MKIAINLVPKSYSPILVTKVCQDSSTFVSDFCKYIYDQFLNNYTYLISCPTGKGKSHMVINDIIPLAYKRKKKVLLLVNRTKLAEQYLKEIRSTVVEGIIDYNPTCHSQVNYYDHCTLILTYQQLEYRLTNNLNLALSELDNYDVVVADEVHYWLNDSTFNPRSRLSAEAVLMFLCTKTRYLMTATMEDIMPIILQPGSFMEPLFTPKGRLYNPLSKDAYSQGEYNLYSVKYHKYIMPTDYSYLDVHYFNKIETIIDYIVVSGTESKWLFFVDSKSKGKDIVERLNSLYNDNHPHSKRDTFASFISSEYREINNVEMKEIMDEITENKNTNSRVLVSTSVLDNGVSLKSKELLHIVICTDNKVSFIQMLGRKRLMSNDERVQLYIPTMDVAFFTKRIKKIEDIFCNVDQVSFIDFDSYMTDQLYKNESLQSDYFRNIAFPFVETINSKKNSTLVINELSRHQLRLLYKNYQKIVKRFETDGDDAFIREQLDWLGLSYDKDSWLPNTSQARIKKELELTISPHLNKEVSKECIDNILEEIKPEVRKLVKQARSNRIFAKHANTALESVGSNLRIMQINENVYRVTDCEPKQKFN